ncbi:cytosolic phospholipase A2 zeta-like [Clupea harengus]|uniref:Cytosolic phospholipase A2 zeta-like n=1 Tax=Clupea harengus TaxID=7950 RepID=A0A6P8GHW7_CLUHA|nr:cytosolic phospholipase A2 zeta-like [Clupea harengus]
MSTLYENADWSLGDLGMVTEPMKVEMIKRYQNILSEEQLSYYWEEMGQKGRDGLPVSPIDMWGLAIEHLIYGKVLQDTYGTNTCTLTHKKSSAHLHSCEHEDEPDGHQRGW